MSDGGRPAGDDAPWLLPRRLAAASGRPQGGPAPEVPELALAVTVAPWSPPDEAAGGCLQDLQDARPWHPLGFAAEDS